MIHETEPHNVVQNDSLLLDTSILPPILFYSSFVILHLLLHFFPLFIHQFLILLFYLLLSALHLYPALLT